MSDDYVVGPPNPPQPPQPEPAFHLPGPQTCCGLRRKIAVGIIGVLAEEQCGVPDTELADVLRFDLRVSSGKPIIAFRYCPWCGKKRNLTDETRVTDIVIGRPPVTAGGVPDDTTDSPSFEDGYDPEAGDEGDDPSAGEEWKKG